MLRETKKNFLIDLLFFVTVAAIIYFVFKFLSAYLFPFVIGLIITAIVQRPANFISQKTKLKKGVCALLLVILTYLVVSSLIFLLGYFIYVQGYKLAQSLPGLMQELSATLQSVGDSIEEVFVSMPAELQTSVQSIVGNLLTSIGTSVTGWVSGFAASAAINAPEFIVATIVTVVASCYIAKDFDNVKKFVKGFVSPKYINMMTDVRDIVFKNVFKLIKSYIIIMLITFVELSCGMLILRVENGIFVALIIAIVDILPVLGCGTVLIPWGIIALVQGDYLLGAGLLILYVVILIIRNIIEPKIIGDQVGLHPLITLLTIFIGLRLLGVIGMFALPIAAIVIYQLYKNGKLDFLIPGA